MHTARTHARADIVHDILPVHSNNEIQICYMRLNNCYFFAATRAVVEVAVEVQVHSLMWAAKRRLCPTTTLGLLLGRRARDARRAHTA